MTIRNLDSDHDWVFGQGRASFLTGQAAIGLNLDTRLLSFKNDCFWAMDFGVDWWNLLSGKNPAAETGILLQVREMIITTPDITAINSVDAIAVGAERALAVIYDLSSIFTTNFTGQIQPVS